MRCLRPGDHAPLFDLPRAGGGRFTLESELQHGPVVVAFFPFAFTSTCTRELCTFSDWIGDYKKLEASVVGVSCDAAFSQAAWARSHGIAIPLASDFQKTASRDYGVLYEELLGHGPAPKRSVFVVDRSAIVRYSWCADDADLEPDYAAVAAAVAALR